MKISRHTATACRSLLVLVASSILGACGGGSSSEEPTLVAQQPPLTATTGMVGILFTDKPTEEFSAITLNVVEAILIPGEGSELQQQQLFEGSEPIDLLNLTNFSEPIMFGEVEAGTYTKLRLRIDDLTLHPKDGGEAIHVTPLPANGKIDLLQSEGFEVLPGRTLMLEIDMEANQAIKAHAAGKSGKYRFRPVVKVKVVYDDDDVRDKLVRVEGFAFEILDTPLGNFQLCDVDSPDFCVEVATGMDTSIFGADGLATEFGTLAVDDMVVVIGEYSTDPEIVLNALVLEIGGNAEQVKGNVVSDPADNQFLLLTDVRPDPEDLVVELQLDDSLPGTRYFDENGPIDAAAIVLGVDVEVEGVKPEKANPTDPDLIRAALVFLEAEGDTQISGTIVADTLVEDTEGPDLGTFQLALPEDAGTLDICVVEGADIVLVDEANSEAMMGTFDELAADQSVDVFGQDAEDGSCFEANEVIVEVVAETT